MDVAEVGKVRNVGEVGLLKSWWVDQHIEMKLVQNDR